MRLSVPASALALALVILSTRALAQGAFELVPSRNAQTDEEQEMSFYLGPLVFQIKNKNLILPFGKGGHPFDASTCGSDHVDQGLSQLCVDGPRSVFLQMPLTGEQAQSFQGTPVTLGYKQGYVFYKGSADGYATEPPTHGEGGHVREPSLDRQSYEAVRIVPSTKFGTTIVYFATGKQTPHMISCSTKPNQQSILADSLCSARTWFLADEFPEQTFSLEYSFPASKIDQAPLIEQEVVRTTSAFPRTRIKWPPATSGAK
jgi:hypothetical protein